MPPLAMATQSRLGQDDVAPTERSHDSSVTSIQILTPRRGCSPGSRPPSTEEMRSARSDVAAARDPIDGLRDLLWVMMNTREFIVNH